MRSDSNSTPGEPIRFSHPAAAHGLVEIHEGTKEDDLCLGIQKLSLEEAPLGIEHFEITGVAVVVTQLGKTGVTP